MAASGEVICELMANDRGLWWSVHQRIRVVGQVDMRYCRASSWSPPVAAGRLAVKAAKRRDQGRERYPTLSVGRVSDEVVGIPHGILASCPATCFDINFQ